jgi:hypothetical protein
MHVKNGNPAYGAGLGPFAGIPSFMRQPASRNLDGIDYDSPGEITSILAANLVFEFLSLLALKKR